MPEKMTIDFKGLGNFGNNVLFAKPEQGECLHRLLALQHSLKQLYHEHESQSMIIEEGSDFTPHLTILKLSRDKHLFKKVSASSSTLSLQ
jgi:2'-5' RNA ligase